MNKLKRLFLLFTNRPLISFTSHGCQGQILEYQFSGVIIGTKDTDRTRYYSHEFMYIVKVTHSLSERVKENSLVDIPAWYCIDKKHIIIHID
jgi:hypothetical protein